MAHIVTKPKLKKNGSVVWVFKIAGHRHVKNLATKMGGAGDCKSNWRGPRNYFFLLLKIEKTENQTFHPLKLDICHNIRCG